VCVCVYVHMCLCVCVSVWEKDSKKMESFAFCGMESFAFCCLYFSRSLYGYICVRKRIRVCMRESACVCVCRRKMERDAERYVYV